MAIDEDGLVRVCNEPMLRLLSRDRGEVIGRAVGESVEIVRATEHLRSAQGSPGGDRIEYSVLTRDGRNLSLMCDVVRFGGRGDGGMVLRVIEVSLAPGARAPYFRGDERYTIATSRGEFGLLKSRWQADPSPTRAADVGRRCYEVMSGRDAPCTGCPVPGLSATSGPVTAVVGSESSGGEVRVATAEWLDDSTAAILIRRIPASVLRGILGARVALIAEQTGLSARERAVLELSVAGSGPKEIASALGISTRTVKFHQANVRRKASAVSQSELVSLVLHSEPPRPKR